MAGRDAIHLLAYGVRNGEPGKIIRIGGENAAGYPEEFRKGAREIGMSAISTTTQDNYLMFIKMNMKLDKSPTDRDTVAKAELELRKRMKRGVELFREHIPGFENCFSRIIFDKKSTIFKILAIMNSNISRSMKTIFKSLNVVPILLILIVTGAQTNAQDNAGKTLHFTKRHLCNNPHESCAIADINLDGHLDIISRPYIFYGPDFYFQAFQSNHLSEDYISGNSTHVYDVDKDGLPDIITGFWTEEGLIWYKNPGNSAVERGTPWEMHEPWKSDTLTRTRGRMEMFAMHDYNNDGIPEFHSSCWIKGEPVEVWRFTKDTGGKPKLEPFVLGTEGGGHGYGFGDINGDGREDVLCEVGWYERPEGNPFAGPWKFHGETDLSEFHPSCPMIIVKDLNEDGLNDIIFGRAHAYGLYWWEQLEPGRDGTTRWEHHIIDESWSQVHVISMADLDNDGTEELIAGKRIWAHRGKDPGSFDPAVAYYYKWDKSTEKFTRHTLAGPGENIGIGMQIGTSDLNGDGRLDIVAADAKGLWVFFNQGY